MKQNFEITEWTFLSEHISQSIHPGRNNGLDARPITGPYNAVAREMALAMIAPYYNLGESLPADVFVLSHGVPETNSRSKIGGIPCWPLDRKWPTLRTGRPAPFIAQFDFSESRDIIPGLRADLLVLFGDPEEDDLWAYWETGDRSGNRVKAVDLPVRASSQHEYFGARWRTRSFPDCRPIDGRSWSTVQTANGIEVTSIFFATQCLGFQIGCAPCVPPQGMRLLPGERILCSVSNVFVSYDVPFPFLNRPQPVTSEESDQLLWKIAGGMADDRLSAIYVIESDCGELRCEMLDF